MDYISREAAKIAVCRSRCRTYCQRGCCELTEAIRKIPAADVREVKRGKYTDNGWFYTCSECGYQLKYSCTTNFCPNCGAQMDMREEHDD